MSREKFYRIPLPGDADGVALTFPVPMTAEQWDFFMGVLPLFRVGLVQDELAEYRERAT
jgi:hypothetical protein